MACLINTNIVRNYRNTRSYVT